MRRDLGTLHDPALLILVSLSGGPRHGYGVMEDVERYAGIRLGPGTLYGALERLERDGLVHPLEPTDASDRRRPYRLTSSGEDMLRERIRALSAVTRTARSRMRSA